MPNSSRHKKQREQKQKLKFPFPNWTCVSFSLIKFQHGLLVKSKQRKLYPPPQFAGTHYELNMFTIFLKAAELQQTLLQYNNLILLLI